VIKPARKESHPPLDDVNNRGKSARKQADTRQAFVNPPTPESKTAKANVMFIAR